MRRLFGLTLAFLLVFLQVGELAALNPANNPAWRNNTQPASTLTLTAPIGTEHWALGSQQAINWNYTGSPGSTVKLLLLKSMTPVATLAVGVPIGSNGKGTYAWTISQNIIPGQDYRITVQSETSNIKGTGNTFAIVQSAITPAARVIHKEAVKINLVPVTVELPKTGPDPYVPGWTLPVKWTYIGTPAGLAKILLLKNDQVVAVLHPGTSWGSGGSGAFNATMPADQFGFVYYTVKVVSSINDHYAGSSEKFIAMPRLKVINQVTDPRHWRAGRQWKVGQTAIINWDYSGGCGNTVNIKAILTNDQWAYDLQAAWPIGSNWHGSFSWTIPDSIPAGEYRLYFTSATSACNDRTAPFTITH